MTVSFSFVSELPDPPAFEAMMLAYARDVLDKWHAAGGPAKQPEAMVADTLRNLSDFLPPGGRLLLAHDTGGTLIGCGMLRKISADAAEFKRLYIMPHRRGSGLGRQLFLRRIAEARAMGCRDIYADTVVNNTPMLTMYAQHGFTQISRYPGNANPTEMEPFLVYLHHKIAQPS